MDSVFWMALITADLACAVGGWVEEGIVGIGPVRASGVGIATAQAEVHTSTAATTKKGECLRRVVAIMDLPG